MRLVCAWVKGPRVHTSVWSALRTMTSKSLFFANCQVLIRLSQYCVQHHVKYRRYLQILQA